METETTEYKTSLAELKQGLISLSAMLNKHAVGELWFGIAPDGTAVGLTLTEKTLRDVSQQIAAHIEPRIYPEIQRKSVDEKPCLVVRASGLQAPYFAYGRAWMRVADESRQMSAHEVETLILKRHRLALFWDHEPAALALDGLNETKIRRFVEAAKLPWDSTQNVLEKLGLLSDGKPVNAARLFFADAPVELRCAVFASQTSATILDRHDYRGDILELIEEAEKYILQNIHIGMRLDGLRRVDVPEIAREALREAIINAFCHRDWRDPDYTQIAIYKDRVEIRNPGGLYDGLTLDDLKRGNVSRRRNPLIAELLRRIHLVEAWGRGMPLILENAPTVTFSELGGLFIASFVRPTALKAPKSPENPIKKPLNNPIKKPLNNPIKKPIKNPLTPNVKSEAARGALLRQLSQHADMSISALAAATGLNRDAVRYHLDQLKRSGLLRRHGPRNGGWWELLQERS